jgi:hypothetical protein
MMKRFQRKRRGGADNRRSAIDASSWLPRIVEQGLVGASPLEAWTDSGVPDRVAAIGRGERTDGSPVLVAFSPHSATEALLGGLAAVHAAGTESPFAGELLVVAPQWPAGARRVLGLLGTTDFSLEPIAAPGLSEGRVVVEPEPMPRILAANAAQLAARMTSPEARSAFARATAALEGLAAKHGGCVRVGADRVELVVLARRVAEVRAEGESAVLEVQVGGRSTTPLSGADLAGALDGLEGQLRRRLNDRKVREGEEGLRGRVIGQLAAGSELRNLRPWPQPGTDQDAVDGVGVNAEGTPVVVAVREAFDWAALAAVLESLAPLEALMPVLFADAAPPLRLGTPRLLLAAERFEDGLERALASLVVAYELRDVSGERGASLDLVARSAGEGAERRPARRGRRRGGRGRSSEGTAGDAGAEEESGGEPDAEAGEERPKARTARSDDARAEERSDGDEPGRGRGRRRRRSRRGRAEGAETSEADAPAREGREGEETGAANGGRRKRRFEEVSLLDLDDGPDADEAPARADAAGDDEDGDGARRRRGRRRGRRGPREDRKEKEEGVPTRATGDDEAEDAGESLAEDDLVDADDLSEILARLSDDVPDFEGTVASDPSYDDDEELDEDGDESSGSRRSRRGRDDSEDESKPAPRKRSAILVHADVDSLFAAILLARDIRQLEGMWVYPQTELMTFFRSIATDLRDDTPIFLVGFAPSPAHDVVQAANLYRGRITWFDRHAWPPEDLAAMRDSIGAESVLGGVGIDSSLPLVLETCTRRSRFSDKLVDLATGRFTEHDFERWGRLWRHRAAEIARKSGDIRSDIAALLAGRPSDLAKEAALVEIPPPPPEVAWVAERDFRLVHFGGHVLVVFDADPEIDIHLSSRIARERYGATLSLARLAGEEAFVFAGDETTGKRALDYMAIAEHLVSKLEWVEARPDADHVSRFAVRDVDRHPERLEEVIGEIAMGRSLLER